jgi:hypothetical protein
MFIAAVTLSPDCISYLLLQVQYPGYSSANSLNNKF